MLEKPESKAMSMIWVSGLENSAWARLIRSSVKKSTNVVLVYSLNKWAKWDLLTPM